jgi:penicillin-binding protein 2
MSVELGKFKVRKRFKEDIEPEEIFMDSKRLKESPDGEREKLEKPIKEGILKLFFVFAVILLVLLFFRSFQTQIIKGDYWRNLADQNRIRSYPIKSLRGIIYDRNKAPLAINIPKLELAVIPADLVKEKNYDQIIERLAQILNKPRQEIETKIKDSINLSYPVVIEENIEREKAVLLEPQFSDVSAIRIIKDSFREYENGLVFSHILGYLGKVDEDEVAGGDYLIDDFIGRTDLEKFYENILRGTYGQELVEVDNLGRTQKVLATKEAVAGEDLILSIDGELQKKLYQAFGTRKGAGIAVNPQNGKILALVSFPSFDNNDFIKGLSPELFKKIFENPNQPLFNRAIAGTYPPGSTIKPMLASAVLKEGIISPDKQLYCPGFLTLTDKYNRNISYTFNDWKAHGSVNIYKAIAESCDVFFYTVGGGYGEIKGLGPERIEKYLKLFGWGKELGIDLPGEKPGFIPSPAWKQITKNQEWFIGDTYNLSIGQGEINVTPLQLTLAIASIANGGKLFQPQLLENEEPQIINQDFIEEQFLEIVRKGMRQAVTSGSAQALYDLSVKAAAKTGTAQVSKTKAPHAWFTVFAPYENPEIVLTILVENGGEGSTTAVPIAKEVLSWYFGR